MKKERNKYIKSLIHSLIEIERMTNDLSWFVVNNEYLIENHNKHEITVVETELEKIESTFDDAVYAYKQLFNNEEL